MKLRRPAFGILVALTASLPFTSHHLLAQPAAPGSAVASNAVRPTVTKEMGDAGGKFFGKAPDPARTRRYYIAAEAELWDYAPQGLDPICGKPLPPPLLAQRQSGKVRYVQYTDETFTTKVLRDSRLGILGPVLRGVTGEFLAVTFLNRSTEPLSMHPHGVKYDKDSEGSYYQPRPGLGAAVAPGARFTYVWQLDEESGPMPSEPSSKGWLYHSHVNGDEEANMGLIGFLVVTDPKRARADGTPNDVDREQAALFMVFDESGLGAAEREAAEYGAQAGNDSAPVKTWAQVQEQLEQGTRHAINGFIFGNTPGLEANEGERVRWYLFALGSERDFHTAHWHGMRVKEEGRRRTDVVELLPASMKVADMTADNPGSWLFHCHVADHMMEGMFAHFIVHPRDRPRADGEARFFGLWSGRQSLRVRSAEVTFAGGEPTLSLSGMVTVFDAFSVFAQPIRFELLGASTTFTANQKGRAQNDDGELVIRNAGRFGVVQGGQMEFELKLRGSKWREPLEKLRSGAGRRASVPVRVEIAPAVHNATAAVNLPSEAAAR
jgi:manganese oxidase